MSVVFPEPDGPIRATYSPRSILKRNAVQGADLDLAERIGLMDLAQLDERQFASVRGPV